MVIAVIVAAVLAAALTFGVVRLLDRLRRKDAESEAKEIVRKAQQDVENRRREAELEIKEHDASQRRPRAKRSSAASAANSTSANACSTSGRTPWKSRPSKLRKQEKIVEARSGS